MQQPLEQIWDLDVFFPGGSNSEQFAAFLNKLEEGIAQFIADVSDAEPPATRDDGAGLVRLTAAMQSILSQIREADSFVGCLASDNQFDKKAVQLGGRIKQIQAGYSSTLTLYDELLLQIADPVWEALLQQDGLQAVAFNLDERRTAAKLKMTSEMESLAGNLAVSGYHGWADVYNTAVSKFSIPFEENGETVQLSAAQAHNKMSVANRSVREQVFAQWEKEWGRWADFCADALNHLGGFRLNLYEGRGWSSVLQEPLAINRMSERTLNAMWDAIDRSKDLLVEYMNRKAKLLGVEKLSWHDINAPLGQSTKQIPYDEAAEMIVEQFRKFSPRMADFAVKAFEQRWIEAADRPEKRPGGFCTPFPVSRQTRIFMTYAGTPQSVETLAHELGHAFHDDVTNDLPPLAQEYAMNVAETASTLAELIVSDSAVKQAEGEQEKIALLDGKVQNAVSYFMNIHTRFIFETSFYEARKDGMLTSEQLSELMLSAQKTAFKDALSEYHPTFWASKQHFYLTEVPFYNFPYTFGYLFSTGIYARAIQEGSSFEDKYVALLRDTGRMPVEQLAKQHLDVDLEQPDFWQAAIDVIAQDIRLFLQMTESA